MSHDLSFDVWAATDRLMHFLGVEGVTGQEEAIGREVAAALRDAGVPKDAIAFDDAHKRIPLPTQTGNLIVTLPGTVPGKRVLFMTHLDTVPLCAGAKPVFKGKRIVPAGKTALGGDNRTGVAVLVNLLATLLKNGLPHPPLTALFTVREESGLWGARFVNPDDLGSPALGFNVDGRSPRELTVGAVGAERWEVEIEGRASHAGVAPERGVSATVVASLALADLWKHGWFGKVKKGKEQGTSNVGSVGGRDGRSAGEATNVVTDYAHVRGESRSHSLPFVRRLVREYRDAFCRAGAAVTDDQGRPGKVRFRSRLDYHPFRLKDDSPVVRVAQSASRHAGWDATLRTTNGGLDANWLVRHKVPTVTFGAGQHNPHTVEEYVDLAEFEEGCRLALALAAEAAGRR
jgi:tripeptide aminopeptidase